MNKIKKQKNKNYGDVINGDKFGLDEKAVEALISNAVAVLSQQFEGVRKNNEDLIDGVRNELYKQILDIKNGQADIRGAAQNNFKRIEAHQQEFTSQIMTVLTTLANRLGGMEEALSYFRSQSAKAANDNYDRFSKWQEDQIENARKNLIRETSREHPNIDNVKECALALLEMASDDFLARFYLAACSENYRDAITFLNETNVDEHTQEELKEVIDYLTKHLRSEWILSASALVERSSSVLGRDENSFRKEIRGPFEREVQKIGRGIYNIIPDGCVFIAYNHDDIAEVSKLIDYLEEAPEIQCFAAFRNVRNGLGAEEYDKILRRAMSRCSVFVLYSTYQSRNMGGSFEEIDHIVQDDYNRAERSGHPEFGKNGDYKHLPAGYKKPRVEYLKESYRPNEANSLAKMFFGDARHRTEPKELRNRILDLLHGREEEPPEEQRKAEEARKVEEAKRAEDVKSGDKNHKVIHYANGDVFEGEYKDGKSNGHGVMRYANGDVFEGEYKDGKRNGHGVMRSADGDVFEGEYKDDKRNGHGVFRFANGYVYEGEWKDGKYNGHGVFRSADGDVFEGEYKDDKLNGHWVFRFANGYVYEGEWKEGKRNGHWVFRDSNGDVFEVDFKDGEPNSYGVMRYANGNVYEGEWKDNKRNGHGVFRFAHGNVYEGEWKDNKYNGHGVFRFADGDVFEGEYKDGKAIGHGVFRYAHGNVYEGDFKDDKRNGHGVFRWADGDVYEGDFKDDKRNGHGVMRYADGDVFEGEWKDDKRNGHGVMRYANGNVYEGEWKDGKCMKLGKAKKWGKAKK